MDKKAKSVERINAIWKLCGIPKRRFAKMFGIPLNTLSYWTLGTSACPEYTLDCLELAVRVRFGKPFLYRVVRIDGVSILEQRVVTVTPIRAEAIEDAKKRHEEDGREYQVRLYNKNIEEPGCMDWTYDPVEVDE